MNIRSIMIALLRYELNGACDSIVEELRAAINKENMPPLYELSKKHDMAHMLGAALDGLGLLDEEFCDAETAKKFREQYMLSVMRYRRIKYELERLCALLEKEKISHMPLKGSVIRAYYPEPWMRTSCDIDVLVHPEDVERVEELVKQKLNYVPDGKGSHDVAFFSESGIHVEIHYALIEDSIFSEAGKILSSIWEHTVSVDGGEHLKEMSDEMYYFYHVAHMAKHFVGGGCGVRPFMDLWIMTNRMQFDKSKRDEILADGKLVDFEKTAVMLSSVWFDGRETTDVCDAVANFIFDGGVYGNFENNVAMQQVRNGGKFGYAMSKIFLPYEVIKFHYPILQKHKWLTPFYEVRRWFKLLFCGGFKRSVSTLKKNSDISTVEAKKNAELLSTLGLK